MPLESIFKSPHLFLKMSFPPAMLQLMREAVKPEPDFRAIADIISLDPVLTTTVLNLVNSAFYGLSRPVRDLKRAAVVLGTRELLKLAVSISYHNTLRKEMNRDDFYREWRLIVWSSIAAGLLAERLCPEESDTAYLCCLLKDTSLLFLLSSAPSELPKVTATKPLIALKSGQLHAEEETWGMHHGALSQLVLSKWGVPASECESIRYHHNIDNLPDYPPATQAVILATQWAEMELGVSGGPFSVLQFEMLLKNILGLDEEGVDELRAECLEKFQSMLQSLGMDEDRTRSYYHHSLQTMQGYYFLGMDLFNAEGGVSSAARIIGRHLQLNWDLGVWELALRSPHTDGYLLFSFNRTDNELKEFSTAPYEELPWGFKDPGMGMVHEETIWGELRFNRRDLPENELNELVLYLRFIAQGFARYSKRQAVMEDRADILDSLPVGVAKTDLEGRLLDFNVQFCLASGISDRDRGEDLAQLLGAKVGISLGTAWKEFLVEDQKDSFRNILCFQRGGPDMPRDVCLYLSAHKKKGLAGDGILFLMEDVTEVSDLELQALNQRDFLERLVVAMRDAVFTVDFNGNITFSMGEKKGFYVGDNLFETSVPMRSFSGVWGPDFLKRGQGPVEVQVTDRDGTRRPIELVFSRLEGRSGRQGVLLVGRDMTVIRRLEEKLKRQATYDDLTGLFNRSRFQDMLEREIRRSRRTKRSMGLIFFDLDGFKGVNDTKGHLAGDDILRRVGGVLISTVRQGMDFPCRYGGDEFTVIVTELGAEELRTMAERIRTEANAELRHEVTLSLGAAMLEFDDDVDSLVKRADQAAYRVKAQGGDGVSVAE